MKLSIIVPCYNEVDNIGKLQYELLPIVKSLVGGEIAPGEYCAEAEIILVDDGSQDGTLAALVEVFGIPHTTPVPVRIVPHTTNMGLGAAIRTGMRHATGDVIVTTDSDGTYEFRTISKLLRCLLPDVDLVTASPYHPQGGVDNVPGYRLILSRGSSLIYRILVDWQIHTYTALFRAYRRRVIEHVMHEADGFLGGTELLVKAILAGFHVAEYPTVLHSRAHGVSKAKLWRTTQAHLQFQARVFGHRLRGRPWPSHTTIGEQQ